MTELEKFKRRMIRMVARLQLQEKKTEEEMWIYLKEETKCDCKWLWDRMRTLTVKRLKRLLIAEDKQESITAIARMSLTDWLLFDLVLVHEKIDVIGTELPETVKVEPRPLFELFALVQRFDLEGLSGDRLAAGWTAATMSYNECGRQCSPMLLQRRWFQLKEATRYKFYKFWYTYRGNAKNLDEAMTAPPTRLQMAIARRYPHIITTPFQTWEEQIEKGLVILPERFEEEMKNIKRRLPQPVANDAPDIILVEPEVETIDLRVDSNSENELKEQVESEETAKMAELENGNAVASISVEETPDSAEQHTSAEAEEDLESQKNITIPIESTVPSELSIKVKQEMNDIVDVADSENVKDENTITELEMIADTEDSPEGNTEGNDLKMASESTVNEPETFTDSIIIEVCKGNVNTDDVVDLEEKANETNRIIAKPTEETQPDNDIENFDENDNENVEEPTEEIQPANVTVDQPQESMLMPQITNVFGNVHIEDATLARLSSMFHNQGSSESQGDINLSAIQTKTGVAASLQTEVYSSDYDEDIEDDIIKTEIIDDCPIQIVDDSKETTDIERAISSSGTLRKDCADKSSASENIKCETDRLFEDVITDVTFDDEGIEFVDDGIAVDDPDACDETHTPFIPVKNEIQTESDEDEHAETAKFDLKLLMEPVVYTTKLDDMLIFQDTEYSFVKNMDNIDSIIAESMPVSSRSINNIVKEKEELWPLLEDDKKMDDDLFENSSNISDSEYITENHKIKLTSNLLQKPRNRNYNPIMLCKNPDFNTRLKRLTAGFLSSTRNRQLLKACKPLTIDVSKTFECKMYNNTVYLKSGPVVEKADENITLDSKIIESQQTTSVIPSAIPVQSLIDNTKTNLDDLYTPHIGNVRTSPEKLIENPVLVEDIKHTNPSHKYNSWPTNQRLLIAEVSPLKPHAIDKCQPPVHLITQNENDYQNSANSPKCTFAPVSKETENTNRIVICSGTVVGGANQTFTKPDLHQSNDLNKMMKFNPQTAQLIERCKQNTSTLSKRRITKGFWNNKPVPRKPIVQTLNNYVSDHLLTIDTVNRIINVIAEPDSPYRQNNFQKLLKAAKKKILTQNRIELQIKLEQFERRIRGEDIDSSADKMPTNDKILIIEKDKPKPTSKLPKYPKPKIRVKSGVKLNALINITDKTLKNEDSDVIQNKTKRKFTRDKTGFEGEAFCCAARFHSEAKIAHKCSKNCACCCKHLFPEIDENELSIKKACESIESVVQNTRKLLEKKENSSSTMMKTSVDVDTADSIEIAESPINVTSPTKPILVQSPLVCDLNSSTNCSNPIKPVVVKQTGITSNLEIPVHETAPATIILPGNSMSADKSLVTLTNNANHVPKLAVTGQTSDCYVSENSVCNVSRKRGRPPKYPLIPPSCQVNTFAVVDQRSGFPKKSNNNMDDLSNFKYQNFPVANEPVAFKKDKVLFLSSRSMSKEPNDQPLFLGKNKILLTNIKLPRNQGIAPESLQQRLCSVQSPTSLPKGVNMVLSPNGELTCLINPPANLDAEQIANLSSVLSTLKQQISAASLPALQPAPIFPHNADEIVNVSDDENISEKVADHELATDKLLGENSEIFTPVAQSNSPQITVQTGDENLHENTKTSETLNLESETICDEPVAKISQVKNNENINTSEENIGIDKIATDGPATEIEIQVNNDTAPPTASTVEPSNSLLVSPHVDISTDNNAADNDPSSSIVISDESKNDQNVSETANVKKKTILSDLMEMSGIFEEDAAPLLTEPTPPVEVPAVNIDVRLSNEQVLPRLVLSNNQPLDIPELNTVTSFSELKYASDNNGFFFKLDLETGKLAPINVSIRKNQKQGRQVPIAPKQNQVIDLTDEQDVVEMDKTTPKQRNTKNISARKRVLLLKPPVKEQEKIKPLKLFKVIQLQKKLEDGSSNPEQPSAMKGYRKQTLSLRLVDVDDDHERQVCEISEDSNDKTENYTVVEHIDSDDSSDDEPLAVKVRRKNDSKPEDKVGLMEVDSQNIAGDDTGTVQAIPKAATGEDLREYVETGVICVPTEIKFETDQESDEDCILGV